MGTQHITFHDWNLNAPSFLFDSAPLGYREVGPGPKERAHAPAQKMEKFVDIVPLKQLMKRVLDHSVSSILAIIHCRRMNALIVAGHQIIFDRRDHRCRRLHDRPPGHGAATATSLGKSTLLSTIVVSRLRCRKRSATTFRLAPAHSIQVSRPG